MAWSEAQTEAIEARGKNLLVAAAAGSGKTSVLVERIIQRILRGECDIDHLLVVTFTNAAAAEMRERIETALAGAIAAQPDNKALARQLILFSNASISTLHSFCQSVIRRNFTAIDLDPQFRLANEQELRLIQQDVLEEVFEAEYEQGDDAFLEFVNEYSNEHGDEPLHEIVLQLYHYAQSMPFPSAWLDSLSGPFQLEPAGRLDDLPWIPVIKKEIARVLAAAEDILQYLQETAANTGCDAYLPDLQADADGIRSLRQTFQQGTWEDWYQAFAGMQFSKLHPSKADAAAKKLIQEQRKAVIKSMQTLQTKYFQEAPSELWEDLRAVLPVMQSLCQLTKHFAAAFSAEKRERCLADFSDLEHFALQILCAPESTPDALLPSAAALALQTRYEEVMVDEFQDVNGVQRAILSLISRQKQPNLFVVGDVKQSIYRFRLADPSLFLAMYHAYAQGPGQRILLSENFRSRESVLSAVNFLFSQLMVPDAMEIAYDDDAALHAGMEYPAAAATLDGPVELDLIACDDVQNADDNAAADSGENLAATGDDGENDLQGFSLEAQHIANRLQALMESRMVVFDKMARGYRPIQWRDIVILLRSVKGKAMVLLDALRGNHIPAYASVDAGYFEENEVRVMLALLSVIDNAHQDIPLAAVLYSPIGSFSAAELAAIRAAIPAGDLFSALLQVNEPETVLPPSLCERVSAFLSRLEGWKTAAMQVGVPTLLWQLYRDTGYYDYVGGMPGGLLRQANLRMLVDRAEAYEQTDFRGLFRFLRFIGRMQNMDTDLAVARTLGESENVVRILSIHKSKGLEFPVVLLADIGKRFNVMDTYTPLLMHRSLGLGPYRVELDKSIRYPTLARLAIAYQSVQETKAEELRVLYVALTRAREKLILVGSGKNLAGRARRWCRYAGRTPVPLPDYAVMEAGSFLDWIGMALVRHSDGEAIRELADLAGIGPGLILPDASHWQVNLISAGDIRAYQPEDAAVDDILQKIQREEPLPSTAHKERVEKILGWQYDLHGVADVPAKLSVTEIKRRFAAAETGDTSALIKAPQLFTRPDFIREAHGMTAAEYGTMMHSVLQHIDWQAGASYAAIEAQLDKMVEREILLPEQRQTVNTRSVYQFFSSPLGLRLQRAKKVWRELPFSRVIPARRFYPEVQDDGETIFSQGIIDLLFQEEEGLVLVDYKTDRDTQPELIRERYSLQIQLYSEAIEEILHRQVRERYLYMLRDGSVIALPMAPSEK